MRITKEQNAFWLKHFEDETKSLSNEIRQLSKQLPDFRWDDEGFKKLLDKIKQLIYKRDEAYHKWYTHKKIADGFDV